MSYMIILCQVICCPATLHLLVLATFHSTMIGATELDMMYNKQQLFGLTRRVGYNNLFLRSVRDWCSKESTYPTRSTSFELNN